MITSRKKIVALFGLTGVVLLLVAFTGGLLLLQSPQDVTKLRVCLPAVFWAGWMGGEFMGSDGVILQDKRNNCGPAALKMVFDHYGITSTLAEIESKVGLTQKGSSMLALKQMAELKGLKAEGWRFTLEDFLKVPMPAIVFVHEDHFAVVDSVTPTTEVLIRDPALGNLRLQADNLMRIWNGETLVFRMKRSTDAAQPGRPNDRKVLD